MADVDDFIIFFSITIIQYNLIIVIIIIEKVWTITDLSEVSLYQLSAWTMKCQALDEQ